MQNSQAIKLQISDNISFLNSVQFHTLMDTLLPQFEPYKRKIPQFIIKLYHILEHQQFSEIICWVSDNNEILIKSPKKLEDKVLPHFFRHKHLSSFIRQLNMYGFSKANKLTKQKNHTYFRNELFKKGQMYRYFYFSQLLTRIKRKSHKKKDGQNSHDNQNANDQMYGESCESHGFQDVQTKTYAKEVNNAIKQIEGQVSKLLNLIIKNQAPVQRRPRRRTRIEQEKLESQATYLRNPMETAQLKKKLNRVLQICTDVQSNNISSLKTRETIHSKQKMAPKIETSQMDQQDSIMRNGLENPDQPEPGQVAQIENKNINLNSCRFDSYGCVDQGAKVMNMFKSICEFLPRLDSVPNFPSQPFINPDTQQ